MKITSSKIVTFGSKKRRSRLLGYFFRGLGAGIVTAILMIPIYIIWFALGMVFSGIPIIGTIALAVLLLTYIPTMLIISGWVITKIVQWIRIGR